MTRPTLMASAFFSFKAEIRYEYRLDTYSTKEQTRNKMKQVSDENAN